MSGPPEQFAKATACADQGVRCAVRDARFPINFWRKYVVGAFRFRRLTLRSATRTAQRASYRGPLHAL